MVEPVAPLLVGTKVVDVCANFYVIIPKKFLSDIAEGNDVLLAVLLSLLDSQPIMYEQPPNH
jgi:hypothetical protein